MLVNLIQKTLLIGVTSSYIFLTYSLGINTYEKVYAEEIKQKQIKQEEISLKKILLKNQEIELINSGCLETQILSFPTKVISQGNDGELEFTINRDYVAVCKSYSYDI